jgi:hypothetical protein
MSYEQALLGAIIALTGAIGVVYADLRKRADACEQDRRKLWETLAHLGLTLKQLKGKNENED